MSESLLTPAQHIILRMGLGLSFYVRKPTRNWLNEQDQVGRQADVEALIDMELLERRKTFSFGGAEYTVMVTPEGQRLAMDEQARNDAANPDEVAKRAEDFAKAHVK